MALNIGYGKRWLIMLVSWLIVTHQKSLLTVGGNTATETIYLTTHTKETGTYPTELSWVNLFNYRWKHQGTMPAWGCNKSPPVVLMCRSRIHVEINWIPLLGRCLRKLHVGYSNSEPSSCGISIIISLYKCLVSKSS